jgi:hypothetical protein
MFMSCGEAGTANDQLAQGISLDGENPGLWDRGSSRNRRIRPPAVGSFRSYL